MKHKDAYVTNPKEFDHDFFKEYVFFDKTSRGFTSCFAKNLVGITEVCRGHPLNPARPADAIKQLANLLRTQLLGRDPDFRKALETGAAVGCKGAHTNVNFSAVGTVRVRPHALVQR